MPEQVLINHAPEIYSPFASAEVGRLREYIETVDSLVGDEGHHGDVVVENRGRS